LAILDAVRSYNLQARKAVDDCFESADFSQSDQPHIKNGLIFSVAVEHRLMHIETLWYMLHWLPLEMKQQPQTPIPDFQPQPSSRQSRVPRGEARLGTSRNDESGFGWDNEYEEHVVDVPGFEIDVYKVRNAEFLKFVEAGGYRQRSLWTDDGWKWISSQDIRHPKFWVSRAEAWRYRAMFGEIQLPLSWPVYVSHAEACAYSRWRNKSLPTEAEFHRTAFGAARNGRDGGERRSIPLHGNFGLQRWEPVPVDSKDQTVSAFGAVGMVGNGWGVDQQCVFPVSRV
jgi:formylglycine-generating enzyme required for sulfatase activity